MSPSTASSATATLATDRATPGQRFVVSNPAGAEVERIGAGAGSSVRLAAGSVVVACESDEAGVRLRIASPAGWVSLAHLEPASPIEPRGLDYQTFLAQHERTLPGDHYGLEFPFSFEQLQTADGPDFLTRAFRASGVLSADNAVTAIVDLSPLGLLGASENAFLTVAYAHDAPGLATELFVKFPPKEPDHKFALSTQSRSEVELLRFSRRGTMPVPVAPYYFSDFCSQTTNYIIITGRIAFGVDPIEPAYRKGRDHLVPHVEEHYEVLARSLARLAGAHRTGALGPEIETLFPHAQGRRKFYPIPDAKAGADRLVDFVGRVAPQLFAPGTTDPAFLARWRDDMLLGVEHDHAVIDFLHADPDYVGFCHPNLNLDNAWYWRDADGKLNAGLLDWGAVGQMSYAQALSGMLMMVHPDRHLAIVDGALRAFREEYEAITGLSLDPQVLRFHYKAALYSVAVCYLLGVIASLLGELDEAEFATMESLLDPRLQEKGIVSGLVWIDNILVEWLEGSAPGGLTPGDACRRIVGLG